MTVDALLFIPVDEGSGLRMIDIETLLDGLLIVVAASGLLAAKQETLHQLILWYEQLDHSCHLMAALGKHLLQSLSLRDGAGEAIKDDTLVVGTKTVIDAGEDIDHQFVGNQLTLVDIALGRLTKFRSVFDLATQHITRGDVAQTVLLNQFVTLRALTSTRCTKNYDILHI